MYNSQFPSELVREAPTIFAVNGYKVHWIIIEQIDLEEGKGNRFSEHGTLGGFDRVVAVAETVGQRRCRRFGHSRIADRFAESHVHIYAHSMVSVQLKRWSKSTIISQQSACFVIQISKSKFIRWYLYQLS